MDRRAKILVVDDEVGIRFFLEEVLGRDGYEVVTVADGETALERIATEVFDLALIDLKMPGISGIEVLVALRRQSPDTVAIILTAHATLETAVEALRQGAHDYLFKPCKTPQIRESVRRGLQKRRQELRQRELVTQLQRLTDHSLEDAAASDVAEMPPVAELQEETPDQLGRFLQVGGLIVDPMRRVITLDGQFLDLSATEFDLLAYMVTEVPRVISSEELVREVQGYEVDSWKAGDLVRYHVYRLRRKIKTATGRGDLIRTVRGVGYALQA